jgi:hypothetical protein
MEGTSRPRYLQRCPAFLYFMNNTIKAGFHLKSWLPVSSMVHHEDVVCTISEHTCDLLFSLPSLEKNLLPMILEDDMGSPVFIFVDQNYREWIKESDVIRNGMDRLHGDYRLESLMDDIDATKIKLFGMLPMANKTKPVSFDDLQLSLLDKLRRLRESATTKTIPDAYILDEWLLIISKSHIIYSIYSVYDFPFFSDNDIPAITRDIAWISEIDPSKVISINHLMINTGAKGEDCKKVFSSLYEFVYIFDIGDKIKIGKSANPYRRITDFHAAFGLKLDSFFLCDKSKTIETKSHYFAVGSALSGEYFKRDCIDDVRGFLEEKSILSFDAKGIVYKDNTPNGSSVKRFSDLSDFIKK